MAFDAGGYFDYPPPAVSMRHVFRSGALDVGSSPHPPRLALAVAPNPARRELTLEIGLAGDAPASVELLDVSGRRFLSRALGPGSLTRREFVALPAGMAPGVYLVRLSQRGSATVRRFAVLD